MDSVWDPVRDRSPDWLTQPGARCWGCRLPSPPYLTPQGLPLLLSVLRLSLSLPAPIALVTCSWKRVLMALEIEPPLALFSGGRLPPAGSLPGATVMQYGGGPAVGEEGVLSLQVTSQGWVPTGLSQEPRDVGCEVL